MKRIFLYTTAAAFSLTLAACNGQNDAAYEADDDVNQSEAAENTEGGLGQTPAVNAVQDAAAGPVGQATAAVLGGDTEAFMRNAALGNMYEIEAAQIALDRSGSPEIRELAQMILDDHSRLHDEMTALLRDANLTFDHPDELDERRQGLIDNLNAAADDTFDTVFLEQQSAAHSEAITLFERYASDGDHAALANLADDSIPMLENHRGAVDAHLDADSDGY